MIEDKAQRIEHYKRKLRQALKSRGTYPINLKWMVDVFFYKHISSLTTHLKRHFNEDEDYVRKSNGKRSWSYYITLECFVRICNYSRHARRQTVSKKWITLAKRKHKGMAEESDSSSSDSVEESESEAEVDSPRKELCSENSDGNSEEEKVEDTPEAENSNTDTEEEPESPEHTEIPTPPLKKQKLELNLPQHFPSTKAPPKLEPGPPQLPPCAPITFALPRRTAPSDWSYLKLVPQPYLATSVYQQLLPQYHNQLQQLLRHQTLQQQLKCTPSCTHSPVAIPPAQFHNYYATINAMLAQQSRSNKPVMLPHSVQIKQEKEQELRHKKRSFARTIPPASAVAPPPSTNTTPSAPSQEDDLVNNNDSSFDTNIFLSFPEEPQL